jgi:hypothetical protein
MVLAAGRRGATLKRFSAREYHSPATVIEGVRGHISQRSVVAAGCPTRRTLRLFLHNRHRDHLSLLRAAPTNTVDVLLDIGVAAAVGARLGGVGGVFGVQAVRLLP